MDLMGEIMENVQREQENAYQQQINAIENAMKSETVKQEKRIAKNIKIQLLRKLIKQQNNIRRMVRQLKLDEEEMAKEIKKLKIEININQE